MKHIIISTILTGILLVSCGQSNNPQHTDNQESNVNSEMAIEELVETEETINKIDQLTSEIDSLMSTIEEENDQQ